MRVVCVKLLDLNGQPTEHSAWLQVGSEYVVLAVEVGPAGVSLRLTGADAGTPGLFFSPMFRTVSETVPSNWRVALGEGGILDVAPASWLRPGFWEDYFDRKDEAVAEFNREKAVIDSQS